MYRYGIVTPETVKFTEAMAPFARQAASEGNLAQFLAYSFLMFTTKFPMDDEDGYEEPHPEANLEAKLFHLRREKEYHMDVLGSIAWECYTCSSISLPCTWWEYVHTPAEEREHIDSTLRPLYEEAHERRVKEKAAEEKRRAEAEAERLRLEDKEDERAWLAFAMAPFTEPAPPSKSTLGLSLDTPIIIDSDEDEDINGKTTLMATLDTPIIVDGHKDPNDIHGQTEQVIRRCRRQARRLRKTVREVRSELKLSGGEPKGLNSL
ncbi:hypothetical protein MD484_g7912, partial [Candolleomyces efflorescens]